MGLPSLISTLGVWKESIDCLNFFKGGPLDILKFIYLYYVYYNGSLMIPE